MDQINKEGLISQLKDLFKSQRLWDEQSILETNWSTLTDDNFIEAIESPNIWSEETLYKFYIYAVNRLYYRHMKTNISPSNDESKLKEAIQHKRIYLFEMVSTLTKGMIKKIELMMFSPPTMKQLIADIDELSHRFSKIRPGKTGKVEVYVIKGKLLSFDLEKKKFLLRCRLLQDKLTIGMLSPSLS